jgi:hypothetical protein
MITRRNLFALLGIGAVAQLTEPLTRKQKVFGSIPNGTSGFDLNKVISHEDIAKTLDVPDWAAGIMKQLRERV